MQRSIRWTLASCTLVLATAMIAAADTPATAPASQPTVNPRYTDWARFKPGATTTMNSAITTKGKTANTTLTTKLDKVTADKVTIEVATGVEVMGHVMNAPARKEEIPAQGWSQKMSSFTGNLPDMSNDQASAQNVTTGTEDIKVGDKTLSTTWTDFTETKEGTTAHVKTWRSDQVPGGVVKMQTDLSGKHEGTVVETLTDFSTGG